MIHFRLNDIDSIQPVGQEPNLYLSWFWLTDGDVWLSFGDQTIYEYSQEAMQHFGNKLSPYNDYYIVRFVEDFTEIFDAICVSIPEALYRRTENIRQFRNDVEKWLERYSTEEDYYDNVYFPATPSLLSWLDDRHLDSGYLVGGPHLSFFRHHNTIRIVWETDQTLDNGIRLWTAISGSVEMNYTDFIDRVKAFGQNFFAAMNTRVHSAVANDWGTVTVDTIRLVEEHAERELEFTTRVSLLEGNPQDTTDWSEIEKLYAQMNSDIRPHSP
ncbi:MAG: DUF5984 family protein [Candidatus Kapaibacterium sp.]